MKQPGFCPSLRGIKGLNVMILVVLRMDSNVQPVKPCLIDLTWTGWDDLAKLNVQGVRQHAKDHLGWKCDTMKYIMMQVMEI
jgi:hypothetical protein